MSNRALRKLQGEAANKKEEEESGEEEEAVVVGRGGGGGFNAFLLVSEAFPGVKRKCDNLIFPCLYRFKNKV